MFDRHGSLLRGSGVVFPEFRASVAGGGPALRHLDRKICGKQPRPPKKQDDCRRRTASWRAEAALIAVSTRYADADEATRAAYTVQTMGHVNKTGFSAAVVVALLLGLTCDLA